MSGEALAAVDGAVALGDEGDGRGRAAGGTGRLVHLAGSGSAVRLAGRTAFLATGGLVLEALLGVELLLAGGKHEFSAAVTANQRLVLVHDRVSSDPMMLCIRLTWSLPPHSPTGRSAHRFSALLAFSRRLGGGRSYT